MIKFRGLATMIVERSDGTDDVRIGYMEYETGESAGIAAPGLLTIRALGDERYMSLEEFDTSGAQWAGTTSPSGYPITVRSTIEEDGIRAMSLAGGPRVPLPIPVLEAIHQSEGTFTMPTTWAMSEDDGFVVTLMLSTDQGLYVRFSGAWHLITNEDVVDGLNVTEVEGSGLDMFDQFDRAGQLVHVSAMPLANDAVIAPAQVTTPPATATVAAGVAVKETPRLATAEDLPVAIAAAAGDEDLQWWVERRAKALGLSAEFPWAE